MRYYLTYILRNRKQTKMTNMITKDDHPSFSELKTSTRTVMVYFNIELDLDRLFKKLYITKVPIPLTKKKKNVDKKKLVGPYGSIMSVQRMSAVRGIYLRNKKHWCQHCQLTVKVGDREKKILTVEEHLALRPGTDIYDINLWCTECEHYYEHKQVKNIPNFLNQVGIEMSIGNINLNIMIFKDNMKIVNCKSEEHSLEAVMILWEDYIRRMKGVWKMREAFINENPRFLNWLVMRNVDFRLGFSIDREKLNLLMNREKYENIVYMSQYEPTGKTDVNIKLYSQAPNGYVYPCLEYLPKNNKPGRGKCKLINLSTNPYRKKPEKKKFTTFIVFGSSEIILSGRYKENMKKAYSFFIKEATKHKNKIKEDLQTPEERITDNILT